MTYLFIRHTKADPFIFKESPALLGFLTGHKEERPIPLIRRQSPAGDAKTMPSIDFDARRSLKASRLAVLWAILALGLGALLWPGKGMAWTGQPLAYVTSSDGILVIDTGDNKVVDTIPGSALPTDLAPDGKHLYAFGSASDLVANISVINTTGDKVVATIPLNVSLVGGVSLNQNSSAIAVTPDGKHVYVTTGLCPFPTLACHPEAVYFVLWEIDIATKKVVAASVGKGIVDGIAFTPDGQHIYLANFDPFYGNPRVLVLATGNTISLPGNVIPLPGFSLAHALAITPDGKHAYVPYAFPFNGTISENVAIIDTATNTLAKTVLVEAASFGTAITGISVTPDGKYVYVSNQGSSSVTVINTANNAIVKTVLVGKSPAGLAITPDGEHVYVANQEGNSVSVIDTASNKVVATVPVSVPSAISIVRPPQGAGSLAFNASLLIDFGHQPNRDSFNLESTFVDTYGQEIRPDTVPVKLQVGPFIANLPAGSFLPQGNGTFLFDGFINGSHLRAKIEVTALRFLYFHAEATGVNLGGTRNPVQVSIGIGATAGLTLAEARFHRDH